MAVGDQRWLFGGIAHPTTKKTHPRKISEIKIPNLRDINPQILKNFESPGKDIPIFTIPNPHPWRLGFFTGDFWGFLFPYPHPIPQSPSNSKCLGIFSNAKRKIPIPKNPISKPSLVGDRSQLSTLNASTKYFYQKNFKD